MDLSSTSVAIAGLGLMGGSLSLALHGKCGALLGSDPNPQTVAQAQAAGIFHVVSCDPGDVLPEAGLVILAAPVLGMIELLRRLPDLHPGSATIIDLGSTKREIVAAMSALPPRFDPLGGHPMCGKETHGWGSAEAGLFAGAPFAFTPLPRTSPRARHLAGQLAAAIGAVPLWLEAGEHDAIVAATSHLPYLVAAALALGTPADSAPLVGPGFRSTTRVAASSPEMMLDILRTNAGPIAAALGQFQGQLDALQSALRRGDWQALAGLLGQAAAQQRALAGSKPPGGAG